MAYVLDTTALVAYFRDEDKADLVEAILRQPDHLFIPFMAVMEARYVLSRVYSRSQAAQFIETLRSSAVPIVESHPAWGVRAAEVKARGGLSLADAWIAALALMHDAELVHKDLEFERVDGLRHYALH